MSSLIDSVCFYPDGTIDNDLTPCNTTATVSACCAPGDSCSTSGLCFGSIGYLYRSGCTDRSWSSSLCPSQCHSDPIANTPYAGWTNIFPCAAGLQTTEFCCASFLNESCCSSSFQLPNTGMAFKPGTDALLAGLASSTSSTASTASSSATSTGSAPTSTATSAPAGSTNLGVALGAGIGIPLGLLACGLLGFLVWREKKKEKRAGRNSNELLLVQKPDSNSKEAQLHGSSRPPLNAVELPNATEERHEMRG